MPTAKGSLVGPISQHIRTAAADDDALCIYTDHAGEDPQRLWCLFGDVPHRGNLLASVDMLVGSANAPEALLIIEIEETGAVPKKLLGDIFAVALGEAIVTRSHDRYAITPRTQLWVCFPANPKGEQKRRDLELISRVRGITRNAAALPSIRFIITKETADLVDRVSCELTKWLHHRRVAESTTGPNQSTKGVAQA